MYKMVPSMRVRFMFCFVFKVKDFKDTITQTPATHTSDWRPGQRVKVPELIRFQPRRVLLTA